MPDFSPFLQLLIGFFLHFYLWCFDLNLKIAVSFLDIEGLTLLISLSAYQTIKIDYYLLFSSLARPLSRIRSGNFLKSRVTGGVVVSLGINVRVLLDSVPPKNGSKFKFVVL